MTNMKSTKRALVSSVFALVLCFAMLLGTTYAWFTDSVTSSGNVIQSGTLDVQLFKHTANGSVEITDDSAPLFGKSDSETATPRIPFGSPAKLRPYIFLSRTTVLSI